MSSKLSNTELLRKISIINAAKCNKTAKEEVAIASFNKLSELKCSIKEGNDITQSIITENIEAWMKSAPIVTEQEINIVLNRV